MATKYTVEKIIASSAGNLVDGIPSNYKNNYSEQFRIPVDKEHPSIVFKSIALIKIIHIITYEDDEDDENRYYWQEAKPGDAFDCSGMDESLDSCFVYLPQSN